jgi:hypothetical protein
MKKYDFGICWSGNIKEHFVNYLMAACRVRKLSFIWICDDNVDDVLKDLERSRLKIKVLLDTEATYNKKGDLYSRICYVVKDTGGAVINDPDRTKIAINKSVTHYELKSAGITVPYTVIVRNWQPAAFRLTDKERKNLGTPFVIKPALGYGQLGVLKDARGSIREIARARHFDRGDNFLLQEKIFPIEVDSKRAWFRVFNVFNTIIPCWWDDCHNLYEHLKYESFNNYSLFPLAKIVSKIAAITRMGWFSTEIAIDKKHGAMRFVAIDYVNDQCDMSALSETANGVPDAIVKYTADCIVETAEKLINNERINRKYTILLKDASIEVRGLGSSPDLLKLTEVKVLPPIEKISSRVLKILHVSHKES